MELKIKRRCYIVSEYIGDYTIEDQKYWSKHFFSLWRARKAALEVYCDRTEELESLADVDNYYSMVQRSETSPHGITTVGQEDEDVRYIIHQGFIYRGQREIRAWLRENGEMVQGVWIKS